MIRLRRSKIVVRTLVTSLFLLSTGSAQVAAIEEREIGRSAPLMLDEVIESADEFFPLLQAVRLEIGARGESLQAASGAFDTTLSVGGEIQPTGFYENYQGSASVVQPTPLWGSRVTAGYRYGEGDFPSYQGGSLTDSDGEVLLGLELPLLRGGRIDSARAEIRRAEIELERAGPEIQRDRLHIIRDAAVAYWSWVATGRIVEVAQSLLEVAEVRQAQIARRAEEGGEAEINLIDNRRLVVERRARLRGAERDFRQATIRLSLFLRDEGGARRVVDESRLPPTFPEEVLIDEAMLARDLERARASHPRLQQLLLEREQLAVEVRLARNEVLPRLDLRLEGSQDFGRSRAGIDETGVLSSDSRSSTEVKLRMRLELPIQRRKARGRLGVARIRLEQLDRRIQFAQEQVETQALIALESLEAAFFQTTQARENVELAQRLRSAEARKLRAGLSNLIDLNIREVQAASAAQDLVLAQQAYFRALAEYRARTAQNA